MRRITAVSRAVLGALLLAVAVAAALAAGAGPAPVSMAPKLQPVASVTGGAGYWLTATDGGIFSYGDATFLGSTGDIKLNSPIVGMAATPTTKGYWFVARDGGIFNYGDAPFLGSAGGTKLAQPIVGMAATPTGKGYWLVGADGAVFNFGDADLLGSTVALKLNQPIVGIAATPSGRGYWLVARDGAIFNFGDAGFFGSAGDIKLNQPIVGMAASPNGKGYWFVAADGGIFAFGEAPFFGSTGDIKLNQPIVGMTATSSGKGYWFVARDGGIFNYGDASFHGSAGDVKLNQPIVGMAATPRYVTNGVPEARNDATSTTEDTPVVVDVVANDLGLTDGVASLSIASAPSQGTATVLDGRRIRYSPAANANGSDALTYRVTDVDGESSTAVLSVAIAAVNDAPTTSKPADTATPEDTAKAVSVTVADVDNAASTLVVTATSSDQTLVPNGNIAVTGSGADRTLTITPAADRNGATTITVTVKDPSGSTAVTSFVLTVTPVNDAPSLAITGGPADASTGAANRPTYSGTAADSDGTISKVEVRVDGGAFGTTGVTGTTSWSWTPTGALADGAHTFDFRSVDDGGASSATATRTYTVDATGPAVTIEQAVTQADPTNATPITFTATFDDAATGFTNGDVVVGGTAFSGSATKTATVTGGPTVFTVSVSGMDRDGTVTASIPAAAATDALGNPSSASSSTDNVVTRDTAAPTVTVEQAAGQADPTSGNAVSYTATFSEPVTGLTPSDVTVGGNGGGARTVGVTGGPTVYTITVTGLTDGTVQASLPAAAATDAAGNASAASTSVDNTVTRETGAPTVTVEQATSQVDPTNGSSVQYTVVFSEPVTGFVGNDVTIGGTAGGTPAAAITGGPTTYTVTVTGYTTDGTLIVSVPQNRAQDAANNGNAASTSTDNTVTVDRTAPTVTINQAGSQSDPTNGSTVTFTAVFSEPVTGFTNSDVTIGGTAFGLLGLKSATVTGGPSTYTIVVSGMDQDGTVTATIPAAAAADGAGNQSTASTSTDNTVTRDTAGPTVTINQAAGQADPTNGDVANFTAVFSEPVTGLVAADVTIAGTGGGTRTVSITGGPSTYNVAVTGLTNGTVTAAIPASRAADAAGNANAASTSTDNSVLVDKAAPSVTINQATSQADPTNGNTATFTAVFSEVVTGFTAGDVTLGGTGGGTRTIAVTGGPTDYTVTVTGLTDGTITAAIPAGAATDAAGNASTVATSTDNSITVDKAAPSVTINQAAGQADPTNGSTVNYTVVFSEPITGFTSADVSITGSAFSGLASPAAAVTGGPTTYTVAVTGMNQDGTVVATVPAGGATDGANTNTASTSSDNTVTRDTSGASVTINQAIGQTDPTTLDTVSFAVHFSEAATGFTAGDVVLGGNGGGTRTVGVTGAGTDFTVTVTGLTDGTITATIPAGAVTDAAGNGNAASTSTDNSIVVDKASPTVTINQAASQTDPTNGDTVTFTAVFSEPVSGFTNGDVDITGDAFGPLAVKTATVSGGPSTYTVVVSGMGRDGTVIATIPAGAAADTNSKPSAASTSTDNTVTRETAAPTVTVNQAAGQADPANAEPVTFTVVFSENVTGFTAADVTLGGTGGGTRTVGVTGGPATYTVSVTGLTDGTVTAAVPADAATDAAGNGNASSTTTDNAVTVDKTAPSVTINQAGSQADPTNGNTATFTAVFSEPVSNFTAADVTIGGTALGARTVSISGGPTTYTVTVTGLTDGTVTATIAAGVANDPAGNVNTASTSTDNSVKRDATAPTVTIDKAAGQADPTNGSTVTFTAVFSEPVTGFTNGDVDVTGTAFSALANGNVVVTGGPSTYTVTVSGMDQDGTVVAAIPAGAATDGVNTNGASTSGDNSVLRDTVAPTVTVGQAAGQADPSSGDTATFTATFSETVTGFTASDVTVGGNGGGARTVGITGTGPTYTITVTGLTDGTVTAAVSAARVTDAAGNDNTASTVPAGSDNVVVVDKANPTVTINQAAGQPDPTNGDSVTFTAVFSEPVTGFTNSDVTVDGTAFGPLAVPTVVVSGGPSTYTVVVSGMGRDGTVTAAIPAAAAADTANHSTPAATSTDATVTRDTVIPSVTLNQAAGQADPTNGNVVTFTVVFSEPVSGFTASDVTLTGTAGGTKTVGVSGTGPTYTVTVTGVTDGTVIASIPAGAATDGVNPNTASTTSDNSVTVDKIAPSFSSAAAGAEKTIVLTFNEPIQCSSVDYTDFTVTIGAVPTAVSAVHCPTGVTTSSSTVVIDLPAQPSGGATVAVTQTGAVSDTAGNVSSTGTTRSYTA